MFKNFKTAVKSIGVLSLVPLATFFIKPDAALAGGFMRSCVGAEVKTGALNLVWLLATCTQRDGAKASARLRISDHIANRNGKLAWSPNGGGFHSSCRGVIYVRETLLAQCKNVSGGWLDTRINLNEKISNQNGVLAIDR
jgi:hypothetical protein